MAYVVNLERFLSDSELVFVEQKTKRQATSRRSLATYLQTATSAQLSLLTVVKVQRF